MRKGSLHSALSAQRFSEKRLGHVHILYNIGLKLVTSVTMSQSASTLRDRDSDLSRMWLIPSLSEALGQSMFC